MNRSVSKTNLPRPFLKWVGGKRQLLPDIIARIDALPSFGRYHEPFLGGGALFFELARLNRLGKKKAYLADNNVNLIEAYQGVRDDVESVIALLHDHKTHHSEAYYYGVREHTPDTVTARAARIIYLNKTCYNGLYRENSSGKFNVPFGRYKNPRICDPEALRAASAALRKAKLFAKPFDHVLKTAEAGDLVYFDPPYVPLSATSSFTDYAKGGFGPSQQERLARAFRDLDAMGAKVVLSNSMIEIVRELYAGYRVDEVYAGRAVNSKADRRGKIPEALITNF